MLSVVEWLMKLEERRVLFLFERLYWELVIFVCLVMQLSLSYPPEDSGLAFLFFIFYFFY